MAVSHRDPGAFEFPDVKFGTESFFFRGFPKLGEKTPFLRTFDFWTFLVECKHTKIGVRDLSSEMGIVILSLIRSYSLASLSRDVSWSIHRAEIEHRLRCLTGQMRYVNSDRSVIRPLIWNYISSFEILLIQCDSVLKSTKASDRHFKSRTWRLFLLSLRQVE
jgi:hypothetical protein